MKPSNLNKDLTIDLPTSLNQFQTDDLNVGQVFSYPAVADSLQLMTEQSGPKSIDPTPVSKRNKGYISLTKIHSQKKLKPADQSDQKQKDCTLQSRLLLCSFIYAYIHTPNQIKQTMSKFNSPQFIDRLNIRPTMKRLVEQINYKRLCKLFVPSEEIGLTSQAIKLLRPLLKEQASA